MSVDFSPADFQLGADLRGKRIVVAMSGGVDSSVVAALAARSGAETIGVARSSAREVAVRGRTFAMRGPLPTG